MFWGLVMKPNKMYTPTVQTAFQLSTATLDLSTCGDAGVQLILATESGRYMLCTLRKETPQAALNLVFEADEQICFSTKGEGVIHLIGNLEDLVGSEGDEDLEEKASPQKRNKKERIAKKVALKLIAKAVQLDVVEVEDELDETFELPKGANKKKSCQACGSGRRCR